MHLHSLEIFRSSAQLELYVTPPDADYGTPEMAAEIKKAVTLLGRENGLFVMGGHEDGILAFGKTAEETGLLVLKTLAMARKEG